jgi:hypothetical protein
MHANSLKQACEADSNELYAYESKYPGKRQSNARGFSCAQRLGSTQLPTGIS